MAKTNNNYYSFIEDDIRYMECSICGSFVDNVDLSTTAAMCYRCLTIRTIKLWDPNEIKPKSNKQKGWHWMKEFVDKDGTVFHKGKEMPELKGTLPPTKIKKTAKKKRKDKKLSYESKIKTLAREYKKKQKLKKEFKRGINK